MKKLVLAFLFCSLIGCKPGLVDPEPIIPPPPAPIVTLDVPANAGYLQDVTISWSSLNTKTVTKSFVDGTEVTGSFVVKAIAKTTTFYVTGQGAGGVCTVEKTVSVKIPTMSDSLAIHGWKLKSREYWKISTNTLISWSELSAVDLSDVKFYTLDGYVKQFHAGQTTAYASFWYTLVGKIITSGDQVYTITRLTGSNLQYEQVYKYAEDQKIVWFYEAAP